MQACKACGIAGAVEVVPPVYEHVSGARDVLSGVRAVNIRLHTAAYRVCRFCHLVTRGVVGALLTLLVWAGPALAGALYVEGGVGAAFFRPTVDDGTWRQDGVQPPNFKLADQAWTLGLGYRVNARWSIQAHYFDWGEAGVKSRFVSDEYYDPVNHRCLANCQGTYTEVVDRMRGVDLTASRYWSVNDAVDVYLKGGGAVATHELKWGNGQTMGPVFFKGTIPMLVVGGGVCAGPLCFDTTLYQGTFSMNGGCLGGSKEYDCGYPLSKRVITTLVLFKLPLTGWR